MTARRVAFINEKGGTCKTTLAVHTAAWLAAERDQRVLLLDLDTQGHAGKSLGIDVRTLPVTVSDLLVDPDASSSEAVLSTSVEGLDLLPANRTLSDLPERLSGLPDRFRRLALVVERLVEANGYDFVVFDAPPSLGLVTMNIMVAAEEVVVPVSLTYFSLDGCAEIVSTVEQVRENHDKRDLAVSLIVPTLYRRTRMADEVLGKLTEYFEGMVAPPLGFNVKIDEAQSHGRTIWEYAPRSKGAAMLAEIASTVFESKRRKRGRRTR